VHIDKIKVHYKITLTLTNVQIRQCGFPWNLELDQVLVHLIMPPLLSSPVPILIQSKIHTIRVKHFESSDRDFPSLDSFFQSNRHVEIATPPTRLHVPRWSCSQFSAYTTCPGQVKSPDPLTNWYQPYYYRIYRSK
jgi:hypothetical protein